MRTPAVALALTLLVAAALPASAQPMLSEPSLSPDGREIAFVSGDDIWTVAAGGGEAQLLVAHPAAESRPLFSPDGRSLAFISTRSGNGDIYVLELATGVTRRITWDDARDQLDAWSRDGRWLYFSSGSREADSGASDVWRVPAAGGTPMQVTAEKVTYEYNAAPAPDGKSVAFVARGFANNQWWRHGRSHMDESQLALVDEQHHYRTLTADGAKQLWPMWSPDGKRLWFSSDRDGNENLWRLDDEKPSQVTHFTSGRMLWPSIGYDGRAIVFERDFGIWKLDTATGKAAAVSIALRGASSTAAVEHRRLTDHFSDLALSPDGKKFAFTARGEVFAAAAKEPGDALRVTNTPAIESQPVWMGDSRSLIYVSDRDGHHHLYRYDFASANESQLTSGDASDVAPRVSPDGKVVAFQRNHRDLVVLDLATSQLRTVATGFFDRPPYTSDRAFDFSPDSRWLAYLTYGDNGLQNAWIVSLSGGAPRQVSFLANTNSDSLSWSRDGRFLMMTSGQRTEPSIIARVDLVPLTPKFREEQFRELFREPVKPEEKTTDATKEELKPGRQPEKKTPAVTIVFDDIRNRTSVVPVGLDVNETAISPDGKWIAFTAVVGDDQNVYVESIDDLASEPAVPKQLTATTTRKRSLQFSPDSKEVWYLDGGRVAAATIDPIKPRPVAVTAEMDVDFNREKQEAFVEGWSYLRDNFFDEAMNGVDWDATRARFAPLVSAAKNPDEFRRLLQLMIGELNSSHLGAAAPPDTARTSTGRIGVRFDRDAYDRSGTLQISEVVALSPAAVANIHVGETIVAVDGVAVTPATNFDSLLDYKIGKRTVVTLTSHPDGSGRHDAVLQPVKASDERALTYRAWVNANRDYVARASKGRLGYVHMYDMSSDSLQKLYLDLDAENRAHQGVVIDLRNNHGGFVNAYAIDVFARRGYMTMVSRDLPPSQARTALGQRSLEKPTVLVINRHSLSDAEDFTEGYRALGLGKVVGEPTAGWIVYTSNFPLIDGTILRLPGTRILDASGKQMEMNPRPVDTLVIRPIGESYDGKDSQLDAAVQQLVK